MKMTYENQSMVDYYNEIVTRIGLFNSEKHIICKYIDKDKFILDVGCGAGRTTIGLKSIGYKRIVGVDISGKMIKQAKCNDSSIEFLTADALNLPFESKTFDTVFFSFNGLMLIPGYANRKRAISEFKRVLKPEGYLIFSTPYLDNKLNNEFWARKIEESGGSYDESLSDIYVEDMGVENIYIHIPLVEEVKKMLVSEEFKIVELIPRIEVCLEEQNIEEELDDNIYWIARGE